LVLKDGPGSTSTLAIIAGHQAETVDVKDGRRNALQDRRNRRSVAVVRGAITGVADEGTRGFLL